MAQVIEISDIGAGPAVISLNKDDGGSSNDASSAISAPSGGSGLKSVNFGGGLDLLMNDKKAKSKISLFCKEKISNDFKNI